MRIAVIIVVVISHHCYAQVAYDARLSSRLEEIKKLDFFNNDVVISDDTSRYGFPRWDSMEEYYQDDLVTSKGETFRAIVDSKGQKPGYSPNEWEFIHGTYHPYQFLRDTAKVDDLKKLLTHHHPYIRTYSFGALAHRKIDGLFKVIMNNLSDTTRIEQVTADYGYEVCPADLMIQYEMSEFSSEQKSTLKTLIMTKYPHLKEALKLLTK